MPLLLPYDASGLDGKLRMALDDIVARIQIWAGKQEGINANERINELTNGISSLSVFDSGDIVATGRSTARTGFLMCDGSAVSRTTYASLFTAIGTAYGAGDGTNTFNVPNFRGRFLLGKATSGTGSTLGSTGGAIDHTHTGGTVSGSTASESSHTHSISASGTHTHGVGTLTSGLYDSAADQEVDANLDGSRVLVAGQGHLHPLSGATAAGGDHNHGGATGGGGSHSHGAGTLAVGTSGTANPPFQVVNYMIKT